MDSNIQKPLSLITFMHENGDYTSGYIQHTREKTIEAINLSLHELKHNKQIRVHISSTPEFKDTIGIFMAKVIAYHIEEVIPERIPQIGDTSFKFKKSFLENQKVKPDLQSVAPSIEASLPTDPKALGRRYSEVRPSLNQEIETCKICTDFLTSDEKESGMCEACFGNLPF